jgi:hypothetical protein
MKRFLKDNFNKIRSLQCEDLPIHNVYLCSVQKTGSQWFKKIFNDEVFKSATGLREHMQRRYEYGEFVKRFPIGTFVPGLYLSYDLFAEIDRADRSYTIYTKRDPRDIIVSWYYSMLETHSLMGKVPFYREELEKLNVEDGIHFCIEHFAMKLMSMRTWHREGVSEGIRFIEFSDIAKNPDKVLKIIVKDMGVDISDDKILAICKKYTKTELRKEDLKNRGGSVKSHYRMHGSSHKEVFSESHYQHFYSVTGNLTELLGYKN